MPIDKEYIIRLSGYDLGQLLDGLEARSTAWRHTALYLDTGQAPSPDFVVEECTSATEAQKLADHCDQIITHVLEQKARQDRP